MNEYSFTTHFAIMNEYSFIIEFGYEYSYSNMNCAKGAEFFELIGAYKPCKSAFRLL